MGKDIRQLFEQERNQPQPNLTEGHEARFLEKLNEQLPQQSNHSKWRIWLPYVAAAVVLITGTWAGLFMNPYTSTEDQSSIVMQESSEEDKQTTPMNVSPQDGDKQITLSDISPDLKKVETYFISSITVGLANLQVSEKEQEMADAYLIKINELDEEYKKLTQELNTIGVNEMTIKALIENLNIRLQLLQRLKRNLNHANKDHHETNSSDSI